MEASKLRKRMPVAAMLDPKIAVPAIGQAFVKLDPRTLVRNPVIFVLEIVTLFRAKVVDVAPETVTIEATGSRDKLEALLRVLEPYGIKELVQSGVVAATVRAMTALGARPTRIEAVIGPAICPLCYEVPEAMREEVAAVVPEAAATSRTVGSG